MKIYLDNDYKCHTKNDGTLREIETEAFESKCKAYICGYRFVPQGETWTRSDGAVFHGEMIAPWRDYAVLEELQGQYEATAEELEELREAFNIVSGVSE